MGSLAGRLFIAAVVWAPFVVGFAFDATICPLAAAFDLPCPGCGLTRATVAAFNGDFSAAFSYHPLFFAITPLYIYGLTSGTIALVRGPKKRPEPLKPPSALAKLFSGLLIVLLVAMLAVYFLRFAGFLGGPVPVGKNASGHYHPFQETE